MKSIKSLGKLLLASSILFSSSAFGKQLLS